jgi:hypothetical protein
VPVERLKDRLEDCLGAMHDIAVPESQNPKALSPQEGISSGVIGCVFCMLTAVKLDHNSRPHAGEIADIWANGSLPAEPEIAELALSKVTPQQAFRVGRIPT